MIETSRFVLTKMTINDGDKYHRLCDNERVMKYVTGRALSRAESDEMLETLATEYPANNVLGRYFIDEKETGTLIGAAKLDIAGSEAEIGYRILEEFWGKGYATEIAQGLIFMALTQLKSRSVIAFVNIENHASVRVLQKSGMEQIETIKDLDEEKYLFRYTPKTNLLHKTWARIWKVCQ